MKTINRVFLAIGVASFAAIALQASPASNGDERTAGPGRGWVATAFPGVETDFARGSAPAPR